MGDKQLNRLYFLCGLIVFISVLSHKKWEPFSCFGSHKRNYAAVCILRPPTKEGDLQVLLCSPIPFIIIFPFRPWYDGKSTNAQFKPNEIQSCKFSALKQRLLRQSVHIHKLCIQCSHLLFYLLKKYFPCFRYKKWEVPLSHTKMWRTGTSLCWA